MRSSDFLSSVPRRASFPSRVGYRRRALVRFHRARARHAWTWTGSSAALPNLRRRRRISQVPGEPHVCNPPRSLTPVGPSRSGQTTRVGAASALAYGGRSQRLCFRGSITQQLHSLCTLRSAGRPTTTQHSVPGGGHLSRAAVETLQGSIERFQFFIHSPLPGLAWRTCRSFSATTRIIPISCAAPLEPEPEPRPQAGARSSACRAAARRTYTRIGLGLGLGLGLDGNRIDSDQLRLCDRHWG